MIRLNSKDLARLGKKARLASKKSDTSKTSRELPSQKGRALATEYPDAEITFEFGVAPQPKERARTFADTSILARAFVSAHGDVKKFMASINSKTGEGGVMRSVTPEATRNFEDAIALLARSEMSRAKRLPFSCPLEIVIEFRISGEEEFWPTAQADGDLDNLQKSVKDALNKIAWTDDRLVVRTACEKYCSPNPGISMSIRPAKPRIRAAT